LILDVQGGSQKLLLTTKESIVYIGKLNTRAMIAKIDMTAMTANKYIVITR